MIARKIYSSIWKDGFFRKLDSKEKLLFLYYCFNENVNSIFCFECSDEQVLVETNKWGDEVISASDILKFKDKVEKAGKIKFLDDWVYLVNGRRYESMESATVERGRQSMFRRLSPKIQRWYAEVSGFELPTVPEKQQFTIPEEENVFDIPSNSEQPKKKLTASIEWLDEIPEDEVGKFMEKFGESREVILAEAERCANWCRAKGQRPKDYRAQFRNWMASPIRKLNQPEATNGHAHLPVLDLSHLGDNP